MRKNSCAPLAFVVLILTVTAFWLPCAAAAEDLRLEGIAFDKTDSSRSIAVINAAPLREGDALAGYEIHAIRENSVTLKDSTTGQLSDLSVTGLSRMAAVSEVTVDAGTPEASTEVLPAETEKDRGVSEKMNRFFDQLKEKPAQLVNLTHEMKALYHLVKLNNASVLYYEKNQFFPQHMNQLTLDGYLPESYKAPTFNELVLDDYKIYFENVRGHPDKLGIHADPLDKTKGLRYLYIAEDAVMRVEAGKPATRESPVHPYNQKLNKGNA